MSGMMRSMSYEEREISDLRKEIESIKSQAASYKVERDRALHRVDELENEARVLRAGAQEIVKLRDRVRVLSEALGAIGVRT